MKISEYMDATAGPATPTPGSTPIEAEIRAALDANARLFAAAPDLLEALKRIVTFSRDADCGDHCSNSCMYCQARAAIAKAEVANA